MQTVTEQAAYRLLVSFYQYYKNITCITAITVCQVTTIQQQTAIEQLQTDMLSHQIDHTDSLIQL